jgi:hypothetical protein
MPKKRLISLLFLLPVGVWGQSTHVGSEQCKTCHPATFERWSKTRMANVVRDPKVHPEAVLPTCRNPTRW